MRVERSAEFLEALDRISELFLDGGLLNRLPTVAVENSFAEPAADRTCGKFLSRGGRRRILRK
ncbi:MAG: hypothetical protein DMG97_30445 [Acidobacteria bacterium]|nr:MAG: hypothetical protein DMG97_30445 [Acidobacteriota bacterium]